MIRKLFLLMIVGLLFVMIIPTQSQSCGNLTPTLVVGQKGRVTPGPHNNVRSQTSRSSSLVGEIDGGEQFDVLEGPECTNGYVWWRVNDGNIEGWTPEYQLDGTTYWLEPIIDGVLIQHPLPMISDNELRSLSLGMGGGSEGAACRYEVSNQAYANFDDIDLVSSNGLAEVHQISYSFGAVALARDSILQAEGINPNGQALGLTIDQGFWGGDSLPCVIASGDENSLSVSVAIMPPTAFFFPGIWTINLTTPSGTYSNSITVSNGNIPILWFTDDVVYLYNLTPNEDIRIIYLDEDYNYDGTHIIDVSADGNAAFFQSPSPNQMDRIVIIGRSQTYMQFSGSQDFSGEWSNENLPTTLRQIFWG